MHHITDTATRSALVVGGSRGLGRGIATALAHDARPVVVVGRTETALAELAAAVPGIHAEVADAVDPAVAGQLLDRHDPADVIVVAGATPLLRPLQHQTWETFSVNWQTDVRIAFNWVREALLRPLQSGSRMIVISSGAALAGSPLSGGYAGAKATQRFIAAYAQDEADRAGLGITFTAVLPQITSATDLGRPAVTAYAQRAGMTEQEYLARFGDTLTIEAAGAAVAGLTHPDTAPVARAYRLTAAGLQPLS
ncbi:MAG TPA: SDR family oxidoreductase [Solirubrobacteraceae bacterium]|nr:SDR family oxidoreductase [Solirubrobacteraceae bacterium]